MFEALLRLQELNITFLSGIELEFYSTDIIFTSIDKSIFLNPNLEIKREIGENQFEAVFCCTDNIKLLLENINDFKDKFKKVCNFDAFINHLMPPSGMQINFSLWKLCDNILNEYKIRNAILHSLLCDLKKDISVFTVNEKCIERLTNLDLVNKFRNSPVNVSCGGASNRTVAIRVINDLNGKYRFNNKSLTGYRIEHRVPSSDAKIELCMIAVLDSVVKGLQNLNVPAVELLHGNAFEPDIINQFNLEPII